jgi:hypothetical protein
MSFNLFFFLLSMSKSSSVEASGSFKDLPAAVLSLTGK